MIKIEDIIAVARVKGLCFYKDIFAGEEDIPRVQFMKDGKLCQMDNEWSKIRGSDRLLEEWLTVFNYKLMEIMIKREADVTLNEVIGTWVNRMWAFYIRHPFKRYNVGIGRELCNLFLKQDNLDLSWVDFDNDWLIQTFKEEAFIDENDYLVNETRVGGMLGYDEELTIYNISNICVENIVSKIIERKATEE